MTTNQYNINLDQYGLVLYGESDGSDSSNRTCVVLSRYAWDGNTSTNDGWFKSTMKWLTHKWFPGLLRRNPNPTAWYSGWGYMTRDQTYPYLIAAKEYGGYSYIFRYIFFHALRGFLFTTNIRNDGAVKGTPAYTMKFPDPTGPDFWSVEIRSLPSIFTLILYPLLIIFDIYTAMSAYELRVYQPQTTDVINHVMLCIFSQRHFPTPMTWIMNRYINKASDLQGRLDQFFGKDPNQPKINELMAPYVSKYFGP